MGWQRTSFATSADRYIDSSKTASLQNLSLNDEMVLRIFWGSTLAALDGCVTRSAFGTVAYADNVDDQLALILRLEEIGS